MKSLSNYATRVVSSALWSAYGDALGFITEMRDNARAIKARVGSERVSTTVPWKRRVGGKFGVDVTLPAGCYSDDTQLRLAVCRAIRPDGSFNIEAFAKMELPVWLSYALGAGRGSKAAASSLAREGINWFSNFFDSDNSSYVRGGGNGAAMRIQPHVWSATNHAAPKDIAARMIKDALCTHGHLRGIAGAYFHGMCLLQVRQTACVPGFSIWRDIVSEIGFLPNIIEQDADLRLFWLPVWEELSHLSFRAACSEIQQEMLEDISKLQQIDTHADREDAYRIAVAKLNALDEKQRGSGTKTALLATFLSYLYQQEGPEPALLIAANTLCSDTDTIATMAGALMGMLSQETPVGAIMDTDYIVRQARRMAAIASGESVEQTVYPNLLTWIPPRTQQDCVVGGDETLEVLVLGPVAAEGELFKSRASAGIWQWYNLESGQTILAKRRPTLPRLISQSLSDDSKNRTQKPEQRELSLLNRNLEGETAKSPSINDLTASAIRAGFDATLIGEHLLQLSSTSDGVERAVAYAAIIAKAKLARARK